MGYDDMITLYEKGENCPSAVSEVYVSNIFNLYKRICQAPSEYPKGEKETYSFLLEQISEGEKMIFTDREEYEMHKQGTFSPYILRADSELPITYYSSNYKEIVKEAIKLYKEDDVYGKAERRADAEMYDAYISSSFGRSSYGIPHNYHPRDEELIGGREPIEDVFEHRYYHIVIKDSKDNEIFVLENDEDLARAEKIIGKDNFMER